MAVSDLVEKSTKSERWLVTFQDLSQGGEVLVGYVLQHFQGACLVEVTGGRADQGDQ